MGAIVFIVLEMFFRNTSAFIDSEEYQSNIPYFYLQFIQSRSAFRPITEAKIFDGLYGISVSKQYSAKNFPIKMFNNFSILSFVADSIN